MYKHRGEDAIGSVVKPPEEQRREEHGEPRGVKPDEKMQQRKDRRRRDDSRRQEESAEEGKAPAEPRRSCESALQIASKEVLFGQGDQQNLRQYGQRNPGDRQGDLQRRVGVDFVGSGAPRRSTNADLAALHGLSVDRCTDGDARSIAGTNDEVGVARRLAGSDHSA